MTATDRINELADKSWEAVQGTSASHEMMWKNGFMNGYLCKQLEEVEAKLEQANAKLSEVISENSREEIAKDLHRQCSPPPPPPADRVWKEGSIPPKPKNL